MNKTNILFLQKLTVKQRQKAVLPVITTKCDGCSDKASYVNAMEQNTQNKEKENHATGIS